MPAHHPTDEEIIQLAIECGFAAPEFGLCSGSSELDESAYVAEYAVGERVVRLARALLAKYGAPATD